MNKQLIIALAVCLVSVHAFVRREAPTTEGTILDSISKTAGELYKGFQETAAKVINPDEFKKQLDAAVKTTNGMIKDVQTRFQSISSTTSTSTP